MKLSPVIRRIFLTVFIFLFPFQSLAAEHQENDIIFPYKYIKKRITYQGNLVDQNYNIKTDGYNINILYKLQEGGEASYNEEDGKYYEDYGYDLYEVKHNNKTRKIKFNRFQISGMIRVEDAEITKLFCNRTLVTFTVSDLSFFSHTPMNYYYQIFVDMNTNFSAILNLSEFNSDGPIDIETLSKIYKMDCTDNNK